MTRAVLALDQGSHASRACLFDEHGALRALASVEVATQHPAEGCVEHSATELLASLRTAAQSCLAAAPTLQIEAAGMATQRSSTVCCERGSMTPLSAVLSWQDRRNASWLRTLAAHAPRIRALTGLPLSPHYGASKMRWCVEHLPLVASARRQQQLCFTPLASFLAAHLGGLPPLADPANAARTLLFDSAQLNWSGELLQLFDIQRHELPECSTTSARYGDLQIGALSVPLTAVTGDQSAVPFAFGEADVTTAYLNLGTGAFIQRPLLQRPARSEPLLGSVLATSATQNLYSLEGTVNGAGSAISWFIDQAGVEQAPLWTALESLAESASLPLFQNGVGGLGSPWWQSHAATEFVGAGDTLQRFAAVLESIVFMVATNFALLASSGPPLRRLLVSGGMSRSNWLCQRLATVLRVPVSRTSAEATGRGAAALAAPQLAKLWPPAATEQFEPRDIAGLPGRQQDYAELMSALTPDQTGN
jgi:glycerol kinase